MVLLVLTHRSYCTTGTDSPELWYYILYSCTIKMLSLYLSYIPNSHFLKFFFKRNIKQPLVLRISLIPRFRSLGAPFCPHLTNSKLWISSFKWSRHRELSRRKCGVPRKRVRGYFLLSSPTFPEESRSAALLTPSGMFSWIEVVRTVMTFIEIVQKLPFSGNYHYQSPIPLTFGAYEEKPHTYSVGIEPGSL